MNNKHQELISEKVAEFDKFLDQYTGKHNLDGLYATLFADTVKVRKDLIIKDYAQTLQDTIDTVLKEERERTLEILTTTINANQMLRGWERYWKEVEPNRFVENCIECENTSRILKALDKTPPNKV